MLLPNRLPCVLTVILAAAAAAPVAAQPAKGHASMSAPLVAELLRLLDGEKLTNIAARDTDQYVAALYIPGSQLLVVTGKFAGPERMMYLISQKSYQEAYQDLSGASDNATRVVYSDLGANGLHVGRSRDQPFDMVAAGGKSVTFDRVVKNEDDDVPDEYGKTFASMDEQYAHALTALIAALKKSS